jgi:hypothetical protein
MLASDIFNGFSPPLLRQAFIFILKNHSIYKKKMEFLDINKRLESQSLLLADF